MNGWYFALGLFVGSAWTLVVTRVHFSKIKAAWSRLGRPKYATITVGDVGNQKIKAIKEIRAVVSLNLWEAKDVAEGSPLTLERKVAEELRTNLRNLGVGSALVPTRRAS